MKKRLPALHNVLAQAEAEVVTAENQADITGQLVLQGLADLGVIHLVGH